MRLLPADTVLAAPRETDSATTTVASTATLGRTKSTMSAVSKTDLSPAAPSRAKPPAKLGVGVVVSSVAIVLILLAMILFWHRASGKGTTHQGADLPSPVADDLSSESAVDLPPQPAAEWASQPIEQWPQLVLTNKATFSGHTPLVGCSSFLIKMPDGKVVMGSAKHLLTEIGGVVPDVVLGDLDASLTRWQIGPRNGFASAIDVKGIAETANNEAGHDWLLMELASPDTRLPCTPLVPRLKHVQVGETVYLVSVPSSDRISPQGFFKGVVTSRPSKHYFQYTFDTPVHIGGFAGAPIVDTDGLLLGQSLSEGTMKQQEGKEVEFGGEDAAVAVWLYQHRTDPPAADPKQVININLPGNWTPMQAPPDALISAEVPHYATEATLFAVPKANLLENISLSHWLADVKQEVKLLNATNSVEDDIKAGRIGDRKTAEYEITGKIEGTDMRIRVIAFELSGCYCRLNCSAPAQISDWARGQFEKLIQQIVSR